MASYRRGTTNSEPVMKFIMVGDAGTGKSSLLIRYTKNQFSEQYNSTIGIEFASKRVCIDQGSTVRLQIWDTAGQESFRSIVKTFYRNSAAVFLVFDITKRSSFLSLRKWLEEARENCHATTIFVLVGTHIDIPQARQVSRSEAEGWLEEEQMAFYFETSAKTDINVSEAFEEVGKQVFLDMLSKKKQITSVNPKTNLSVQKKEETKSGCC